jgi:tRNA(Ile2) C34 agmatinyltransferase TiaS
MRLVLTLWRLLFPRCGACGRRATSKLGGFRYCKPCRDAIVRDLREDLTTVIKQRKLYKEVPYGESETT